jgi:hypothetical protein
MPVVHSNPRMRGGMVPSAPRGGKLVKVSLKPGVCILMHEAEARAKGLLPPIGSGATPGETKKSPQVANKKRGVSANKAG